MATESSKVMRLLRELREATERGKVVWERSGGDGQRVEFAGRRGGVALYPQDWDNNLPFVLELLDANRNVIDSFVTGYEADEAGEPRLTPQSAAIVDLYQAARESSVHNVVEGLLEELRENEEPF